MPLVLGFAPAFPELLCVFWIWWGHAKKGRSPELSAILPAGQSHRRTSGGTAVTELLHDILGKTFEWIAGEICFIDHVKSQPD